MEIKKKVYEVEERVEKWKNDHISEIVTYGSLLVVGALSGVYGYLIGKDDGIRSILDDFDPKQGKVMCSRTVETGRLEALMTERFENLLFKNADIVEYSDGSWEFKSEVE